MEWLSRPKEGKMRKTISIAAVSVLAGVSPGWAADRVDLEKQVQELARQNRLLLERVISLEKMVAEQSSAGNGSAAEADTEEEQAVAGESEAGGVDESAAAGESLPHRLSEHVELGGLVEVEAFTAKDFAGEETSDITLATVALHLDAEPAEWTRAHIVLLYEEGEEDDHVIIDEATVTLGDLDSFPAYLSAGRMYLPFGSFATNMISDTLPLALGEINDAAVQAGFESAGLQATLYVFHGDIREKNDAEKIDNWGAGLHYVREGETFSCDVGLGWLNNIGDTDGLGDYLEENTAVNEMDDYVAGLAAHLLLGYGPVDFSAEYIRALDRFKTAEISFAGAGAEPEAWSFELGLTGELLARQTIFSVGYQGTAEAYDLDLPQIRYLAGIRMYLLNNVSLALEYLHDEDYGVSAGGTGDDGHAGTVQLAVGL
jgi:hypothetical protein